ncbi:MAG TPA: TlpA disulfide reductase family protein [Myxococcota bacterium]|nr:TlpA disulfide reductase family protein [Myxococcota bacterium]
MRLLLPLLLSGCAAHRIQALEAENQLLRQELAAANSRVATLTAQGCGAGGVLGGQVGPPRMPPVDPEEAAKQEVEAMQALLEARTLDDAGEGLAARAMYTRIVETWPTGRSAAVARRRVEELAILGKPAPTPQVARWLEGKAPEATPMQILVFWEVWCPHCQRELPELSARADALKSQGISVVAYTRLTKTSTAERVHEFYQTYDIRFPTALEQADAMSTAYVVSGIPAAAVVKDGVIIWRGHPARLTDELIARLKGG